MIILQIHTQDQKLRYVHNEKSIRERPFPNPMMNFSGEFGGNKQHNHENVNVDQFPDISEISLFLFPAYKKSTRTCSSSKFLVSSASRRRRASI